MLIFPAGAFVFLSVGGVELARANQQLWWEEESRHLVCSALLIFSWGSAAGRPVISASHFPQQNLLQNIIFLHTHTHTRTHLKDYVAHTCAQLWCNIWWAGAEGNPTSPFAGGSVDSAKTDRKVLLGGRWCVGRRPRCSNLKAQHRLVVQKRPKKTTSTAAIKSSWDMRPIKTAKWCSEAANSRLQSHAALSFFKVIQQDLIWLSTQRTKVRA